MLRPKARATACRIHVLGRDAPRPGPVELVLQTLRGADPEANGLLNLHIEVTAVNLGIISRTCANGVADVVRTTPVAFVPAAGGMDHGSHR